MTDDTPIRHTPLPSHQDGRQTARLAEVPELYRKQHERLAVELALHMEDPGDVFLRYGYTPEQGADLLETPAFTLLLKRVAAEVTESGLSFRSKAKAISEELLPYALLMAQDPECSSAVRADLIKWTAKIAGNEPKEMKDEGKQQGGLSLNITFSGQPTQAVITTAEPRTIEQEQ